METSTLPVSVTIMNLSAIAFLQELLEPFHVYDYGGAPAPDRAVLQQPRQAVAHGFPRRPDHLRKVLLGEAQVDDRSAVTFGTEISSQPQQQVREAARRIEGTDFRLPLLRLPQACRHYLQEFHRELGTLPQQPLEVGLGHRYELRVHDRFGLVRPPLRGQQQEFTEHVVLPEEAQDHLLAVRKVHGELHHALPHEVKSVSRVFHPEDYFAGRILPVGRYGSQFLQFAFGSIVEQLGVFQVPHQTRIFLHDQQHTPRKHRAGGPAQEVTASSPSTLMLPNSSHSSTVVSSSYIGRPSRYAAREIM